MFTLKGSVGTSGMSADDLDTLTAALRAVGVYDHPDKNLDPIADQDFFEGIRAFQRKRGLAPTGTMDRMDETHRALKAQFKADSAARTRFYNFRSEIDERRDAVEWGEVEEAGAA